MEDQYEKVLEDLSVDEQKELVNGSFWDHVSQYGRKVPFLRDALAAYYCFVDEDVPFATRAKILAPLAYLVLPVDAVPDFLVGIGFTDDWAVFAAALYAFGSEISDRHYASADEALGHVDEQS